MRVFDAGFILAVGALGWGLSLASYRVIASQYRWPMGVWQARLPALPFAIGALCVLLALWAALRRIIGGDTSLTGWLILLFGLGWAVFWMGFLRVGAQSALLLAPLAALLLFLMGLS